MSGQKKKRKGVRVSSIALRSTPVLRDFPDAIRAVTAGAKITKVEWKNTTIVVSLTDGLLRIRKNGVDVPLLLSRQDLEGTDWVVVAGRPARAYGR